jgi:hypothetical protein
MRNQANGADQSERLETSIPDFKTVVVVVDTGQTKQQAWRSHLSKNPEDRNADIKIFHFAPRKAP